MNPGRQPLRRWLGIYGFIALSVLAVFWIMDGITAYRAPAAAAPVAGGSKPARPGRVFILLLDSLRYQTATSPDLMPHLARLRERSTWAEVRTSYNAVTVPSLRAAFTGRDEVSVLGFVQNFLHEKAEIDSVFRRLAAAGCHTAAWSDGSFAQFGAAIAPSVVTQLLINSEGVEDYDDRAVAAALALFREGRHDVVIAHVRYTDYAAHRFGVGRVNYRRDFRRADGLVAQADAAVGAGDTLVVMGDHGHGEDGSHSLGQDVRTLLLYRGPAFKAGCNLGSVPIMAHTWLLGQIFGLPPPDGYTGGFYPEALTAKTGAWSATETTAAGRGAVPGAIWLYVAVPAVFGAGLLWPERAPWMQPPEARWLIWLALPPALAPLPWNGWAGAAVALAILGWLLRGAGTRAWGWSGLAVAAGLGWHAWGRGLAGWHETLQAITRGQLAAGWLVAGGLAVLVTTTRNRHWLMAAVGAVGFLAMPTNYRYGFTGMMVPLLWFWLAGLVVVTARAGRLRAPAEAVWALASVAGIFGFTQLFMGVEASHFIFRRFVPVFNIAPTGFETLMATALVAKVVIFYPHWPRRWLPALVAAGFIGALQHLHWRTWEPGPWDGLLIAGGLLAGWLCLRRRDPELAQVFLLGLLFYLYAFLVRPTRESYDRAACLLAALVLAARWVRRHARPDDAWKDGVVLGVVALLAAGFFTVNWSIDGLEWSRIYLWVPAHVAETAAVAALLVPWIVLKTLLPLFIAQILLRREGAGPAAWPGEALRRLAGWKALTLLLVVTGLGAGAQLNSVYLEGVQQLAVLGILSVGLLFGSGKSAGG